MERLAIGTIAGKAKLMGTIMSLGGAMILTFYKGVEIKLWSTNINLLHHGAAALQESSPNQVLGSLLAVASCVCIAVWLIVQVIKVQVFFFSSNDKLNTFTEIALVFWFFFFYLDRLR